jgi:ubiquinol-cytochrome c reductase iron-sulfur subunit
MSEKSCCENTARRRVLIGLTSVVGACGAAGAAVPFIKSWNPSAKAKAAGAPVQVDVSKLEMGQRMIVEWRGKPVWIVRRSQEVLDGLSKIAPETRDPDSAEPQQPAYASNAHRSIKPEYLILVGICTHLGCSPLFRPEVEAADLGTPWMGGFFCPCHGSKFDMAGRVFKGVPAPTNLEIPPHHYLSDNVIVIGVDKETA